MKIIILICLLLLVGCAELNTVQKTHCQQTCLDNDMTYSSSYLRHNEELRDNYIRCNCYLDIYGVS